MRPSRIVIDSAALINISGDMETSEALRAFSALSQPTRLSICHALTRAGDEGMTTGEIAASVGALGNTTSTHLQILAVAGLVHATREGKSVRYRAQSARLQELADFLVGAP